jgi:transposase
MSISEFMPEPKGADERARRIEVFTGHGRRRAWSAEEKAAIVAESLSGAESVCNVARRHGLTPQQLFTWRRELRKQALAREAPADNTLFVPAIVEPPVPPPAEEERVRPVRRQARRRASGKRAGVIEIAINGVTVTVGAGAEVEMLTAVLQALKASS